MAFEAFLTQGAARPLGRRRLTYTLSIAVHAALVAVGVVYSFWHVEELSPPTVKVTFLSALPPPPPPPPPAGGEGAPKAMKKATPKPKTTPPLVQPKPTLVQPKETPKIVAEEKKPPKEAPRKSDDDDDAALPGGVVGGTKGGTQGGVIGGSVSGTPGGIVDAPMVPKLLAPSMGQQHKLSGEDPAFPAVLRRAGALYVVMAKICVGKTGAVDGVTLMKKADPLLDANVESAVRNWRYSPLLVGSAPAPFCYVARFEFKAD